MYFGPINDSLRSLTSGLGTERDKGASGRFGGHHQRLSRAEVLDLYRSNFLAGRAVDVIADSCTEAWRTWSGSRSQVEAIQATERRLKLRSKLNEAMKLSLRDGGCAIIIGAGGDPGTPLDPAAVRRGGLNFVHVLPRHRVSLGQIDTDPASPWHGQPVEYRLPGRNNEMLAVHPSRVIALVMTPAADPFEKGEPWGDSLYQRIYQPVRDLTQTLQVIQHLIVESKQDIIQVPGLSANSTSEDYQRKLISRFSLANQAKSIVNALILDANETWNTRQLSLAGFPETLDKLFLALAGSLGMPLTLLMGDHPKGFSNGESGHEQWYKKVSMLQQNVVTPAMETLDECLLRSSLGGFVRRPKVAFTWNSLWSMSERELSEIRLKHAQAAAALAKAGVVDRTALAKSVVGQAERDSWLPGLTEAAAAAPPIAGADQPQTEE